MRNLYCLLVALCIGLSATSQKVYFIYFQSDNNAPFYVKLSDKVYSSSSSGYLILPNLVDSTYRFSIGFPSSRSEYRFVVPTTQKDRGFLVKNFDYGPGLFDLQTLSVIRPEEDESKRGTSFTVRNDQFTSLLAKASGDTTLLYVPVVVKEDITAKKEAVALKEEPKQEKSDPVDEIKKEDPVLTRDTVTTETVQNKEPDVATKPDSTLTTSVETLKTDTTSTSVVEVKPVPLQDTVVQQPLTDADSSKVEVLEKYEHSVVRKYSESSTSEGFGLVYFDTRNGFTDTIRLLIPNPKIILRDADSVKAEDTLFLEPRKEQAVKQETPPVLQPKSLPVASCPNKATNSDFLKLRKNMAARETDEEMVAEAKKYFRNKCFTTEQIKNLSVLFLTSAGKYQFFDAAYTHVVDQDQFHRLGEEITDEYYSKRFKALIGE